MRTISSLLDEMNAPRRRCDLFFLSATGRARQGQWQEAATNYFSRLRGGPMILKPATGLHPCSCKPGTCKVYEQLRQRMLASFGKRRTRSPPKASSPIA